ncbi:META domain-containing protein [Limibaculum sp. FT325]|nr:META domain-containing protein [Limibaculum sediminis]
MRGPVRATLRLDEGGTARGSSGCNDFRATYEASPEVLDFGAFALTKRGCQTPVMRVERQLLKALEDVRGWRINAGELLLLDAAGGVMLRLEEGR